MKTLRSRRAIHKRMLAGIIAIIIVIIAIVAVAYVLSQYPDEPLGSKGYQQATGPSAAGPRAFRPVAPRTYVCISSFNGTVKRTEG